jgi:SNF family Na+-dependent transporter
MPLIFQRIPLGAIFAFLWFTLLFLAGVTSSVSLAQPVISFLEDEFDITKKKSATIFGVVTFILCQPAIFFLGKGVLNELDFWGGTFCLVLFATVETIVFAWVFGIDRAWKEIHHGADIVIPKFYKFIIKYITPLFLLFILGFWIVKEGLPMIAMKNVTSEQYPYVLFIRGLILIIFIVLAISVAYAWKRRKILIRKEK